MVGMFLGWSFTKCGFLLDRKSKMTVTTVHNFKIEPYEKKKIIFKKYLFSQILEINSIESVHKKSLDFHLHFLCGLEILVS
jgi:hypothetical protein